MGSLSGLRKVFSSKLVEPGLSYVTANDSAGRKHLLLGPFITAHDAFSSGASDVFKRLAAGEDLYPFDVSSVRLETLDLSGDLPGGIMNHLLDDKGQSFIADNDIQAKAKGSLLVEGQYRRSGESASMELVGTPATVSAWLSEGLSFTPTKVVSGESGEPSIWLNNQGDSFTAIVPNDQMERHLTSQMNKTMHLNRELSSGYSA